LLGESWFEVISFSIGAVNCYTTGYKPKFFLEAFSENEVNIAINSFAFRKNVFGN